MGNKKLTIEEMQRIAENREGKCLSKVYINANTKLLWKCKCGHQWKATPGSIKSSKTWCPKCANIRTGKTRRLTIEEMQKIANERGGKCLSSKYVNSMTKLLWECGHGHQWKATPHHIKNSRWCPKCSAGVGERICKAFFEQIFKKEFNKSYPSWLKNGQGNQMELDGYCENLKIAFEHQGRQHYESVKRFRGEDGFKKRQKDDKLKKELCNKNGVFLFVIPEIPTLLKIKNVKSFIKKECLKYNIPTSKKIDEIEVDLLNAYKAKGYLEEMNELAESRDGKCLSDVYINATTNLSWECKCGYRWEATSNNIKRGTWCPKCGGSKKLTIEEMNELAESRSGKCLSKKYINWETKLLWECKCGNQWKAIPNNVKRGSWCPKCKKHK